MLEQFITFDNNVGVIIAHGDFPKDDYLVNLLRQAQMLICCDGAIDNLIRHNIKANYIIGDCDSLSPRARELYQDRIITISSQNENDLTKAINLAHSLKLDKVIILGATGLREDHTLANISLLEHYNKLINQVIMISDYGVFTAHQQGSTTLTTIPGQQISFFTTTPEVNINCNQLKWPLVNHKFSSWFSGTLNQATADSMTILSSGNVLVFRSFILKKE